MRLYDSRQRTGCPRASRPLCCEAAFLPIGYMRREMSQAETGDPSPDLLRIGTVGEALAGLPVAGGRQLRQLRGALAQPGGGRGREGDDGLAGEVVGRHKAVYGPCGAAPPDGILKCSPSSPALENTGLNGLHKCVFCSF